MAATLTNMDLNALLKPRRKGAVSQGSEKKTILYRSMILLVRFNRLPESFVFGIVLEFPTNFFPK